MISGIVWGPALNLIGFAFSMVFVLLVLIVVVLNLFGLFFVSLDKTAKKKLKVQPIVQESTDDQSEVYAAIAMALHAHFENIHDTESNVITIEKVNKRYTPWSSKIYGLNTFGK
jgi:glutaconyl-CoA/methylmalonyl-CoA decarboxylase subunit delta